MTARFERLLTIDDDEGARQDEEMLYGMHTYGFDRWRTLDATLATIQAALTEVYG